jgi:hypothetical protein
VKQRVKLRGYVDLSDCAKKIIAEEIPAMLTTGGVAVEILSTCPDDAKTPFDVVLAIVEILSV